MASRLPSREEARLLRRRLAGSRRSSFQSFTRKTRPVPLTLSSTRSAPSAMAWVTLSRSQSVCSKRPSGSDHTVAPGV
ncbi:MAG: hypothetical protein ACK56I_21195, partial [bacterium]